MKKAGKIIAYVFIAIVVIIIGLLAYITLAMPNVGKAEDIKVVITPKRVARGKYLTMNVAGCLDCHSKHDRTKSGSPVDTTMLGSGGVKFDASEGFPGDLTTPNLTPHNLKTWTDGEIFRAVTTGEKKDGSAIFPLMPWQYYSKMDREDVYAIIAYLRTLKPINLDHPKSTLNFPLNILVHTMPKPATLSIKPDPKDTVKYGAYLVNAIGCNECHSQDVKGKVIPGLEFAGGKEFKMENGTVRSGNITPDKTTGIGAWTREIFLARFKIYRYPANAAKANKGDFQSAMPWWTFGGMTDGDLASIYAYLRTLKPVKNQVVKYTPL